MNPPVSPIARYGASMAYDQADGYLLLFGGVGSSLYGDTWEFSAGKWTQLTGANSPGGRWDSGMTYDATDGYVFLFGGLGGTYGLTALNDSWSYLGGAWTPISTSTAPPLVTNAVQMTYDSEDGYVLLLTTVGVATYQTIFWIWSGGAWTNVTSLMGSLPSPQWGGILIDDTYDGYVLLFGGQLASGYNHFSNSTWSYVSAVWTQLSPPSSPPARAYVTGAFDVGDQRVVVMGGYSAGVSPPATLYGDTWEFTD